MPSASGLGSSDALASGGRVAGHVPGGTSSLSRRNSVRKAGSGRASAAGRVARGPSGEGRGCGRVVVVVMGSSHAGSVSRPVLRPGPGEPTIPQAVGHVPPVPHQLDDDNGRDLETVAAVSPPARVLGQGRDGGSGRAAT